MFRAAVQNQDYVGYRERRWQRLRKELLFALCVWALRGQKSSSEPWRWSEGPLWANCGIWTSVGLYLCKDSKHCLLLSHFPALGKNIYKTGNFCPKHSYLSCRISMLFCQFPQISLVVSASKRNRLYNITKKLATQDTFWLQKLQKLLSPFNINYQLGLNTKQD